MAQVYNLEAVVRHRSRQKISGQRELGRVVTPRRHEQLYLPEGFHALYQGIDYHRAPQVYVKAAPSCLPISHRGRVIKMPPAYTHDLYPGVVRLHSSTIGKVGPVWEAINAVQHGSTNAL